MSLVSIIELRVALHLGQVSPKTHEQPNKTVAIIGGGLSGLTTAYNVVKHLSQTSRQRTKIVIYDKHDRLGGWCHSVNVPANVVTGSDHSRGTVVFETGPRSIRPSGGVGWLTIDMAHDIGLTSQILTVSKSAPSARNRFLLTSDNGLTLMPSSLTSALVSPLTTPLIRRILPGVLSEPLQARSSLHDLVDKEQADESVDAFFRRRFGSKLADDVVSAMIHGIWSGDSRRLSVRTLFPGLWDAECRRGSVIKAALLSSKKNQRGKLSVYQQQLQEDKSLVDELQDKIAQTGAEGKTLVHDMKLASVWGLKGGLEQLIQGLRSWLVKHDVEIKTGRAAELTHSDGNWTITSDGESDLQPTHVIATVPQALPVELRPTPIPNSTVAVVNLAFSQPTNTSSNRLFPPGFGYLIPRSIPIEMNPHRALGVIFDSDVMPNVDDSQQNNLIKCSVLMGGSYWLDSGPPTSMTHHDDLVRAALETIRLHVPQVKSMNSNLFKLLFSLSHVHHECIPQVPPMYHEHVRSLEQRLQNVRQLRNGVKVAIVGSGLASVGVNGAVKHAWNVGMSVARDIQGQGQMKFGTEEWTRT
ncbi:oxygen-dependent protoporphyrinogen oxidase [Microbotryomycetes sp. JL221]|nr:oxygen-dependent protoporphyrinogen oxidase [Microbotryomycetes sp. JL221]